MSRYYYPNNEVLTPRWVTPKTGGFPWWLVVLPLLLLIILAAAAATWLLVIGPEHNARRATVLILTDRDGDGKPDVQGSGVIINPSGYILTNRHVVLSPTGEKPAKVQVW